MPSDGEPHASRCTGWSIRPLPSNGITNPHPVSASSYSWAATLRPIRQHGAANLRSTDTLDKPCIVVGNDVPDATMSAPAPVFFVLCGRASRLSHRPALDRAVRHARALLSSPVAESGGGNVVFRRDNKVDSFQRQMSALRHQLGGNADEEQDEVNRNMPALNDDRYQAGDSSARRTSPQRRTRTRTALAPIQSRPTRPPYADEDLATPTVPEIPSVDSQYQCCR
jgi:hypothetical protein